MFPYFHYHTVIYQAEGVETIRVEQWLKPLKVAVLCLEGDLRHGSTGRTPPGDQGFPTTSCCKTFNNRASIYCEKMYNL